MITFRIILVQVLAWVFTFSAIAQPKLPSLFTDNMVLQQRSDVAFWGWSAPGSRVVVTPSWNRKGYSTQTDAAGKWKVMVTTPAAGGPFEVSITDGKAVKLHNVLCGEVWLCAGQSNMEMPMKGFKGQPIIGSNDAVLHSSNNNIRLYTVPRSAQTTKQENSKASEWKEATPETVGNFSATGYYFGRLLNELLGVPIGLINCSYGGSTIEAWMGPGTLQSFPEIKLPLATDSIKSPNRTPLLLYNGMLAPIEGYTVKGCIWYQGESNYERPDQYENLFPAMVSQWRQEWGEGNFPFYYAQIAPYNYAQLPPYNIGGKYNSAYLRDAQRKVADRIPNTGMAVILDIGDEATIHPPHKKEAGERLGLLALGKTYGLKGFGYESPAYDTLVVSGSIAEVKFKNAPNWLTSYGKELANFEIAGADKVFYPARAVIYRSAVMVSSPEVKTPVAVRYAFRDFVTGDLFSTEGLPVSSFRTDNW